MPSSVRAGSSSSSAVALLDRDEVIGDLRRAALRLLADPEVVEVRLFGSLARGDATAASDADLLVVVRAASQAPHLRSAPFALRLRPTPVPVDLLVKTSAELAELTAGRDPFWLRALAGSVRLAP